MLNFNQKSTMIIGTILMLSLALPSASALSPWFSSSFQYAHHAIQRFSGCHSLQPVYSSSMNATDYLVAEINTFFDVANFNQENVNAHLDLLGRICLPDNQNYPIYGDIVIEDFAKMKTMRCKTLDDIMNKIYPEMRRAASNSSYVLNFTDIDYEPRKINGTINGYHKNLVSFINIAWIESKFEKENMCYITNKIASHLINLRDLKKTPKVDERVSQDASEGRLIGAIKYYYLEPLFSLYAKLRLALNTEVGEARMAVASGYSSGVGFLKENYSYLRSFFSRRMSNDTSEASAQAPTIAPTLA